MEKESIPWQAWLAVTLFLVSSVGAHNDRVLLRDISTLTLYHGRNTNARRTAPVPQLKCVGGSASCHSFVPQVVQCRNMGSDGFDAQWECKTDMDNAYRFGQVEVTCEGYDYPDDPFVLRGSCGLEYTLDLTKEGHDQKYNKHHQYYGDQQYGDDYHDRSSSYYNSYNSKKSGSGFGSLIGLGVAAGIIYLIYKTCLSDNTQHPSDTPRDQPPPYSRHGNNQGAPPPGFKPEYTSGCGSGPSTGYASSSHTGSGYAGTPDAGTSTGGGFWSGAATGGLLGYLFGSNTGYGNNYYGGGYGSTYARRRPHYGSGFGSGWFGGSGISSGPTYRSSSSSSGSFFSGGGSTGTRTASGFGGTKRR